VVGHYGDDIGTETSRAPAEDEVVEAVPELGDHHQHPCGAVGGERESHLEVRGDGFETACHFLEVDLAVPEVVSTVVTAPEPVDDSYYISNM
jgi:hypothetical protein